jgi:hypothetical protein
MNNVGHVYRILKERGHLEDQDVSERMILEWILKKQGVGMSTEYIWGSYQLQVRVNTEWNVGFRKVQDICWRDEWLVTFK